MKKKLLFLTGTRADFGKLKSLILELQDDINFEVNIFVTGMHLLSKYGNTFNEIKKSKIKNSYLFINQNKNDSMDNILAKTISGLSDYIKENKPDLIVLHGDRLEALAGAIVGSFNNIRIAHIEGGEVSGTIDEVIRHSISKMAHVHFVSNKKAYKRLLQLGENKKNIHIIGSPDIDILNSSKLPSLEEVRKYYQITFKKFSIFMFHPVTTELDEIDSQLTSTLCALRDSNINYIIIYPNNDLGSSKIISKYEDEEFLKSDKFKVFASMRFEYFLVLLKNANFIIGNSSSGIREAPHYGIPTIDLGSRQRNRAQAKSIFHVEINYQDILSTIKKVKNKKYQAINLFGDGNSAILFKDILKNKYNWEEVLQKYFVDI